MKDSNQINQSQAKRSIDEMLKDIENIKGFIAQELIKKIEFNNGKIFSIDDNSFKEQVDSLLNADPNAEVNKGKAVLSFKATEVGIEKKLLSLQKKGAKLEDLEKVREILKAARENLTSELNTQQGLNKLIGGRLANQLLLNSANFRVIDQYTKKERFLNFSEKRDFVKTLENEINLSDDLLKILLNPNKKNDYTEVKKLVQKNLIKFFADDKHASESLPFLDMQKLAAKENIANFNKAINPKLKTQKRILASSDFLKTYQDLSTALADNINAIYKNESLQSLKDNFKDGGELHKVMSSLSAREKGLVKEQKNLVDSDISAENNSIKQELLNNVAKELEMIKNLQSKLNQFSTKIEVIKSNFSVRKAINEFSTNTLTNKEFKQSFFATLGSVIYNGLTRKNPEQLESSSFTINALNKKIIDENNKMPGSEQLDEPELNQEAEQVTNTLKQIGEEVEVAKSIEHADVNETDKSTQSNLKQKQQFILDLLENGGKAKSSHKNDININGFNYDAKIGSEDRILNKNDMAKVVKRRNAVNPEEQAEKIEHLLNNKNEQEQLNVLYSAVINGAANLVKNIIEHGNDQIFNKENCEKIYDAAKIVYEKSSVAQKVIIDKGLNTLSKEAELVKHESKLGRS